MRKLALLSTTLLTGLVTTPVAHAVDVTMYGQVNKTVMGHDDGRSTDFGVYDNDLSSTRLGVKGEKKLDNGLTASVLLEMEMQSNPSNLATQNTGANSTTPASGGNGGAGSTVGFDERHASVGLSGDFGGVVVGQTATASDGIYTQDLTGVKDVLMSDAHKIGGGLFFRDANGALSAANMNRISFTGSTSRADAIRYDSPKLKTAFGNFQGKAAVAQGGDTDVAALYDATLGDFKVLGAASVVFNNDDASTVTNSFDKRYIASGSVLHKSGIGGTVAYTTDELAQDTANSGDPEQFYVKAGYAWDAYEVAADYTKARNYNNPATGVTAAANTKLEAVGVGAQYNMGNGVSLAGAYRNLSAERTGTSLEDIDLFLANLRVKF
ncbi:MAG: hypothetical protein DI585_06715 [Pseudomonas fluorescens]|nr:MAG: hypothetical protein DI585_06715 [Pseudomonas fluorescens]